MQTYLVTAETKMIGPLVKVHVSAPPLPACYCSNLHDSVHGMLHSTSCDPIRKINRDVCTVKCIIIQVSTIYNPGIQLTSVVVGTIGLAGKYILL